MAYSWHYMDPFKSVSSVFFSELRTFWFWIEERGIRLKSLIWGLIWGMEENYREWRKTTENGGGWPRMTDLKYEFHQNNLLKSLKSCLVPFYQISFKITFENKDCISIHEVRLHEEKQLYVIQDKLCNSIKEAL